MHGISPDALGCTHPASSHKHPLQLATPRRSYFAVERRVHTLASLHTGRNHEHSHTRALRSSPPFTQRLPNSAPGRRAALQPIWRLRVLMRAECLFILVVLSYGPPLTCPHSALTAQSSRLRPPNTSPKLLSPTASSAPRHTDLHVHVPPPPQPPHQSPSAHRSHTTSTALTTLPTPNAATVTTTTTTTTTQVAPRQPITLVTAVQ